MSHPDDEDLVDLALGDPGSLSPEGVRHVDACADCSATVASIRRTALLVATSDETVRWESPPASVWESVEAQVSVEGASRPLAAVPDSTDAPDVTVGQQPSAVVASDIRTGPEPSRRSGRRRAATAGWIAGGVAAGLAVGLLAGRAVWSDESSPATADTTTIASAPLDTLDTRQQLGDAELLDDAGGVQLVVDTEPLDAGDGYLEVWLINSDLKRMVSVGVYRGSGPEAFPVSQELIDEGYVIVDVSQEGLDTHPEHSGESLVRGILKA